MDDVITKVPVGTVSSRDMPNGNPLCSCRLLQFIKPLLILLIQQIALETRFAYMVRPAPWSACAEKSQQKGRFQEQACLGLP